MEVARRSRVGARRHHLHRRDLQGRGEDDLCQGRGAGGSRGPVQLKPRRQRAPRDRYSRRRKDQREGVEGADPRGGGAECVESQEEAGETFRIEQLLWSHERFPSLLVGEGGAKRRMRGLYRHGKCGEIPLTAVSLCLPASPPSPTRGEGTSTRISPYCSA